MDRLRKKSIAVVLIAALCLVGLGVYLTTMQNYLSVGQQQKDTEQKMLQMRQLIDAAKEESAQLQETFDNIYKSKAQSLAFMVRQSVDPELSRNIMDKYRKLLEVDNTFVLDKSGIIVYQARPTTVNFTRARFNQLRTVFDDANPSEAFQVDMGQSELRYYGAWITPSRMAVVAQDQSELDELLDETTSWHSLLQDATVGLNGFAFAVSAKDYTFLYHPDEDMIGLDALDAGISVSDLDDGRCCWMTVDGQELFCGVIRADDAYVICAVSRQEINSANAITVIIVLFVFFTVITLVVLYAILLLREERRTGATQADYKVMGAWRCHKRIGRKLTGVSVIGLVCIFIISYYMQTLFSMSRASVSNAQRLEEIENSMVRYESNVEDLTERYNTSYISKGEVAAYILTQRPDLLTRSELARVSNALGVEYTFVFDANGDLVVTDSPYSNFALSDDPEEQSYAFRQLLVGVPYYVQPAQEDDVGVYRQYVGVTLRDSDGSANGFVQISVLPELLESAVEKMGLNTILQSIRVGTDGFAFAVDRDTKNFLYYPVERYIGRSAMDYGMEEEQFQNGDSGYITLGLDKYYASAIETDDAFIYVALPAAELSGDRLLISLSSTGVSLLCLALVSLLLSFERSGSAVEGAAAAGKRAGGKRARMIDVTMPDGTVKKTESAFSRWSNETMGWGEMTPEQKTILVLKLLLGVLAIFIVVAVANKDTAFTSTSVFRYVIDGTWKRGVNVFAVAASVMILCVVSVVSMALRFIFKILSRSMSARGETVIRLVNNLVKYVSVIVAMYFCFAMFGVDTATLLASAGILSLVSAWACRIW